MARMLKPMEIRTLALRPGAKKVAVENFLMSADNFMPQQLHLHNLGIDAISYQWNSATVDAIRAGLKMMYEDNQK